MSAPSFDDVMSQSEIITSIAPSSVFIRGFRSLMATALKQINWSIVTASYFHWTSRITVPSLDYVMSQSELTMAAIVAWQRVGVGSILGLICMTSFMNGPLGVWKHMLKFKISWLTYFWLPAQKYISSCANVLHAYALA